MKKIFFLLFSMFLIVSQSVVAVSNEDSEFFVKPLALSSLDEIKKVDLHLKKMGFTNEELALMQDDMKIDIASRGGKKWAVQKLTPKITSVDEQGNRIVISEDDSAIRKSDMDIQKVSTSDFELWGWVVKYGSVNSSENSYAVYADYKWNKGPFNAYTDKLAMAWQDKVTPYGDPTGLHYWRWNPYNQGEAHVYTNAIDKKLIQGNSWKVNVIAGGDPQDGWGRQEIRVKKSNAGTTGAVEIGYAHRICPGGTDVTISYGVISFSGFCQTEYNDRFNFTY
ncbi:hypothetical protein DUZ99_00835 [Xylanibacillus composti]|uniref:Uncharacterized protein n=1 Tax=Xylanibacillus composti TaxID=1572762 RepID=A0A8J4H046_9BACL|nr:hypothetical protein [Xylanibacillus composti]MDT9723563.1 hypothetical protein [Xylanibacillus composti]GIQ68399.1 hypothetical protein XYCOK13_12230 [Xylanibacillus composti]